jgi:2-dehydro-3-deoxyphosphogluconate aldolase / (4S)-4-hydroxy-2-oxoglutarate aldolase
MFKKLRQLGVVPVVAVDTPDHGLRLCEALLNGGLPVAEITFRTEAAEATIRAAAKAFPEIALGAGTVLTVDQLKQAMDAGAKFAVAPGCNPTVVSAAVAHSFPFAPGVCTPSDVERALELGVKTLKFFPAEASGGITMLKALIGPYGHVGLEFCPTGGIKTSNMLDYLALPQVPFVGGTWIAKRDLISGEAWEEITDNARDAVARAAAR